LATGPLNTSGIHVSWARAAAG